MVNVDVTIMQKRIDEIAEELSNIGLHPATHVHEAEALYNASLQLQQDQPTVTHQLMYLQSGIILGAMLATSEKPSWGAIASLGTSPEGEPLFQPAPEVTPWYGLFMTNNAIARCMAGSKEELFAEKVVRIALDSLKKPSSEEGLLGTEFPYVEHRWTAAALIVQARIAYAPELTIEYANMAQRVLDVCPTATDQLREQAKTLARPQKKARFGLGSVTGLLHRVLPFVAYDLYCFSP